ncbi:MAG: pyridoxal phosphate-dependent aminotransferase [Anaerolineae bacterium]|nr:pyridoxal phosphate-dependent aminotransferase [Anaerolineae bacterium]
MKYRRMPIEIESPEQIGYGSIRCNLTESSVTDMHLEQLNHLFNPADLALAYTDHIGKPELRELIAAGGKGLSAKDVLVTPSAAAALFIVSTALLEAQDHLVVMRPNYATNIETPRAIGCRVDFLDLRFEDGFRFNIHALEALIKPETRLISLTSPHNPTGMVLSQSELQAVINLAEKHNCYLLVDETYREMNFSAFCPLAAELSPRCISVSSLSKSYGLPGIRIGWIITRDAALQELFLAAKEQIFICNSIIDEELAYQALAHKDVLLPPILKRNRDAFESVKNWMAVQELIEWVEPQGGVVCFPRIKTDSGVDVDLFYRILNEECGTWVGPGHWFEMERRFMRIGYGWPNPQELADGLSNLSRALKAAQKG